MSASAQDLRKIKTFEQLLPYLEAELDWPLADYEFDDPTFYELLRAIARGRLHLSTSSDRWLQKATDGVTPRRSRGSER